MNSIPVYSPLQARTYLKEHPHHRILTITLPEKDLSIDDFLDMPEQQRREMPYPTFSTLGEHIEYFHALFEPVLVVELYPDNDGADCKNVDFLLTVDDVEDETDEPMEHIRVCCVSEQVEQESSIDAVRGILELYRAFKEALDDTVDDFLDGPCASRFTISNLVGLEPRHRTCILEQHLLFDALIEIIHDSRNFVCERVFAETYASFVSNFVGADQLEDTLEKCTAQLPFWAEKLTYIRERLREQK